jgi:putative DNA primase/helicase
MNISSDIANAKRLVFLHGDNLRYARNSATGSGKNLWLVWDGSRWEPDRGGILVRELAKNTAISILGEIDGRPQREQDTILQHARYSQSRGAIQAMIRLARYEQGISIMMTSLDASPWLLNFSNGTLNLRTGKLQEHRREDLITHDVGIPCDPYKASWGAIREVTAARKAEARVAAKTVTGISRDVGSESRLAT